MYMYVLVRTDLSVPQQCVQAAHAAIEATKRWPYTGDHPHLVVLGVPSEAKLLQALDRIRAAGIRAVPFIEPDIGHQTTAVATEPVGEDQRHHFRRYQLIKGKSTALVGGAA